MATLPVMTGTDDMPPSSEDVVALPRIVDVFGNGELQDLETGEDQHQAEERNNSEDALSDFEEVLVLQEPEPDLCNEEAPPDSLDLPDNLQEDLNERKQDNEFGFSQGSLPDVKKNLDKAHKKVKKTHECSICGKTTSQIIHLKEHMDAVHLNLRPHKCDICGKAFGYKSSFIDHTKRIHQKIKSVECKICGKIFFVKKDLKRHVDRVHEGHKPYECHICKQSYVYKSHLILHFEKVHLKLKPHDCEVCGKRFSDKHYYKRHLEVVHRKTQAC